MSNPLKIEAKKIFSRRKFIKLSFAALAAIFARDNIFFKAIFAASNKDESFGRKNRGIKCAHDIVCVQGQNPYEITAKAIELIGGMQKFVAKNSVVLIKPNIAWDRAPEYAATTNPDVVAALIDLCFAAGARRVNVFDNTCNESKRCYFNSGIAQSARQHGANVFSPDHWNVVRAKFKYESPMENQPIFKEALECDTFINVPILKHHGLTELTLSMKNLMGVCSGKRGMIHFDIGRKLVDLADFIQPDLNVIDAYRVLLRHGPQGGNLEDVEYKNKVIVGTDPTLLDSYACRLMGKDPFAVPYIKSAIERKFGKFDLEQADILSVSA
ncbi:MAG: DUF362 domain-containing protein [Candidatus Omnitrophica bacterium]|nr:DUF362 domain-containing protein [Candidatus Omnitrophota bacterium]